MATSRVKATEARKASATLRKDQVITNRRVPSISPRLPAPALPAAPAPAKSANPPTIPFNHRPPVRAVSQLAVSALAYRVAGTWRATCARSKIYIPLLDLITEKMASAPD